MSQFPGTFVIVKFTKILVFLFYLYDYYLWIIIQVVPNMQKYSYKHHFILKIKIKRINQTKLPSSPGTFGFKVPDTVNISLGLRGKKTKLKPKGFSSWILFRDVRRKNPSIDSLSTLPDPTLSLSPFRLFSYTRVPVTTPVVLSQSGPGGKDFYVSYGRS